MPQRSKILARLTDRSTTWDVLVIGGGATGLGCAVEAAARGYRTALLEQHDFAKGTSSRSTKLLHGGVRYLRQGHFPLVFEALQERGFLRQNAPHLVHRLPFVIPAQTWWEQSFYGVGLKLYDALAGRLGFGGSRWLSRSETLRALPNLKSEGLRGGVLYYDGQFDDARLAVHLVRTVADLGGTPMNYAPVLRLLKENGRVCGVQAIEAEGGRELTLRARVVVNAAGVFVDQVRQMDEATAPGLVTVSQGIHLVVGAEFLAGETALMVPRTDDGRVIFALPWQDRVLLGTTDTAVDGPSLEPRARNGEVDYLLRYAAQYLARAPQRSDVLSVFAGLRPLVNRRAGVSTAALSREHFLSVSRSGLVTITGGKWTTYRRMGEQTIDQAARVAGLPGRPSATRHLRIHGWSEAIPPSAPLQAYGSDAAALREMIRVEPGLGERLHPRLGYLKAEVVWAAREEMARSVEDVLARRTRALLLDAQASVEAAPTVARILAREQGREQEWEERQVREYSALAKGYMLPQ